MHGQERINPWLVWITMLALIGGIAWLAINYWPQTHSPPLDPDLVRSAARAAASREAAQRDSAASEVLRLADDNAPAVLPLDTAGRAGAGAAEAREVLGEEDPEQ
ncbi:hypothetical protein [Novosphingobium colocasiae]|uniref:hypothetical protein n=1 Tax=Novosphingobium colocasiae TaxID=1256513 RepID=UPI0035AFF41B